MRVLVLGLAGSFWSPKIIFKLFFDRGGGLLIIEAE